MPVSKTCAPSKSPGCVENEMNNNQLQFQTQSKPPSLTNSAAVTALQTIVKEHEEWDKLAKSFNVKIPDKQNSLVNKSLLQAKHCQAINECALKYLPEKHAVEISDINFSYAQYAKIQKYLQTHRFPLLSAITAIFKRYEDKEIDCSVAIDTILLLVRGQHAITRIDVVETLLSFSILNTEMFMLFYKELKK